MSSSKAINDYTRFYPAPFHGWFSTSGLHSLREDDLSGSDSYFSIPIVTNMSADMRKIFPEAFDMAGVQVTMEVRIPHGVSVRNIVITAPGETGSGHSISAPPADGTWHTVGGFWTPEKPELNQIHIFLQDPVAPSDYFEVGIKSIRIES